MKHVQVHTDGGCHGNPGPGAWAAVLQYKTWRKEISGAEPATTNNRMEIQAAVGALALLKEACEVTIHTDSEYLREGITSWIHGWKKKGWLTKEKKPVKNRDLWQALDAAVQRHKVNWQWLKGHAGHAENERCDALAQQAIDALKKKHSRAELTEALARFKENTDEPPPAKAKQTNSFQF